MEEEEIFKIVDPFLVMIKNKDLKHPIFIEMQLIKTKITCSKISPSKIKAGHLKVNKIIKVTVLLKIV